MEAQKAKKTAEPKRDARLSTASAAAELGITPTQFTGLMAKLGITHAEMVPIPGHPSWPGAKLWATTTVLAVKRRKVYREFIVGAAERSKRAAASAPAAVETKKAKLLAECEASARRRLSSEGRRRVAQAPRQKRHGRRVRSSAARCLDP